MTNNDAFSGVSVAGMWRPVYSAAIAAPRARHAAIAARKRHAAAGTAAASVNRGSI